MKFYVDWEENGSVSLLGRMTARDASGELTGVPGEGRWLRPIDLESIVRTVWDLDSATPDVAVSTTELDLEDAVLDEPDATGDTWTQDDVGYNFIDELAAGTFPDPDHRITVKYEVTCNGGRIFHGVWEGMVRGLIE